MSNGQASLCGSILYDVDTADLRGFHDAMATMGQKRFRTAVAFVVMLLALCSLVLAFLASPSGKNDAVKWIGVVMVFIGAVMAAVWLLRGQSRGSQLVFSPPRWLVVALGVCSIFISVTFVIALADGPDGFLSVAYWPAVLGGWFAWMFRPESSVEKQLANESHGPPGSRP